MEKRRAKEQARKTLTMLLSRGGELRFTSYCEMRMKERGITTPTVINVLQRGVVCDPEEYTFSGGIHWRYRVETHHYRVVVTFESENEVVVINAIDLKTLERKR